MVVSGTLSYQSTNQQAFDDNPTFRSFTFIPAASYFLSDRVSLGMGIGYTSSKNRGFNFENTVNLFAIVPTGRYYAPIAEGTFYFFGEAAASLALGKTELEDVTGTTTTDITVYDLSLSPGFAFFPSQNWSIDFAFRGIGLTVQNPEGDDNNTTTFDFAFDAFSPSLSFS